MKTASEVRDMFVALAQNLVSEVAVLPLTMESELGYYKDVPKYDDDGEIREVRTWFGSGKFVADDVTTDEMKEAIKNLLKELIEKVDTL